MSSPDYTTLAIEREQGVATVTLDHPPMNLLDLALMTDLERLGRELEADTETRAVVFQSANPDYFIAHADVSLIQRLPSEVPPKSDELHVLPPDGGALPHAAVRDDRRDRGSRARRRQRVPALARHALRRARTLHPLASPRWRSASCPAAAARSGCRA